MSSDVAFPILFFDFLSHETASLAGLALTSFLAATILPLSSEAVLAAMVLAKTAHWSVLWIVAGCANTLGSLANYWLGWFAARFQNSRWFPVDPPQFEKAQSFYQKWGWPSLLLSWVPFIGDPLTVIAGVFRTPLALFVLVVAFAKFGRYGVVLWLVS